jgi:hypothetical protein
VRAVDWERRGSEVAPRGKGGDVTPIFSQNRVLIVCVPRNQVYTPTVQKMDTTLPLSQYIIYLPNNFFTKD